MLRQAVTIGRLLFVYGTEQMIVVDFLHVRMDLPARLASLGDGETSN